MTFRDIINRVLRTIGEAEVPPAPSGLQGRYHQLVATMVNQVKEDIEDANDWRALTRWVSIPSATYNPDTGLPIPDASARSRVARIQLSTSQSVPAQVYDITDPSQPVALIEMPLSLLTDRILMEGSQSSTATCATYFAIDMAQTGGPDSPVGPVLHVFPSPAGPRSYRIRMVTPQRELTDADLGVQVRIPSQPLIAGAIWYALEERGEELGINSMYTEERYRKALDSAISLDIAGQGGIDLVVV